jgi:hypothetical protein
MSRDGRKSRANQATTDDEVASAAIDDIMEIAEDDDIDPVTALGRIAEIAEAGLETDCDEEDEDEE